MKISRRDFIATTAVGSASLALDLHGESNSQSNATPPSGKKNIIICAHNGVPEG